jgi:hypothetical protein
MSLGWILAYFWARLVFEASNGPKMIWRQTFALRPVGHFCPPSFAVENSSVWGRRIGEEDFGFRISDFGFDAHPLGFALWDSPQQAIRFTQ